MLRYVPRALSAAAVATAMAACAAGTGGPAGSPANDGRYRILIPEFEGVSGDQVANSLRGLVTGMERHTSVPHGEFRRAVSQYGIEQLTPIEARQLAQVMNAQLVAYGNVAQGGAGLEAEVTFTDIASGDNFTVQATGANPRQLGQAIYDELHQSIQGILLASFCNDYLSSEQFEQALDNCEQALEIMPTGTAALYGKATALFHLDQHQESLETYRRLLEIDSHHQDALLGAGLAASSLQRTDEALVFYRQYMELNPEDPQVRMKVAGDVAQAGDVVSAYEILQPGLQANLDNIDYQQYFARVAVQAGRVVGEEDAARARPIYQSASQAFERVIAEREDELEATDIRLLVSVMTELGQTDDAIRFAERGTRQFADDPTIWSQYATVLNRANRAADEIRALSRVIELDPTFENAHIRRAVAHQKAGQAQQALRDFEAAAQGGDRALVGRAIFGMAADAMRGASPRWADADNLLQTAARYAGPELRGDIAFFRGVALFRQGEAIAQQNATQGRAEPARRALQFFQQASSQLQAASQAQLQNASQNDLQQLVAATRQYIDNQEAIIEASRGR